MAKQWWALAVATAMALSSGVAIAAGSNTYGTSSSTDRTTQSGSDTTTPDNSNTNDTSKPIDDSTNVDRTNQSGVDSKTDDMGDKLNQAGNEVGSQVDAAQMKFSDLRQDQVKQIQQKLTDEGFYKGPITGHFGPKTKAALKQFADSKGETLKGDALDSQLASDLELNSDIQPVKGTTKTKTKTKGMTTSTNGSSTKSGSADKKTQSGTDMDSSTDTQTQSGTDMNNSSSDTQKSGTDIDSSTGTKPQSGIDNGSSSTDVQKQSGQDSTLNNGSTGAASAGDATGTGVNAGTSPSSAGSSMGGMNSTGRTDSGVTGSSSSTSSTDIQNQRGADTVNATNTEIIRQAQLALKDKGLLKTEPSGTLDKDTKSALKSFQKDNKLPVTGKLDSKTLAKLGVNTAAGDSGTMNQNTNTNTNTGTANPAASSTPASDSTAYPH